MRDTLPPVSPSLLTWFLDVWKSLSQSEDQHFHCQKQRLIVCWLTTNLVPSATRSKLCFAISLAAVFSNPPNIACSKPQVHFPLSGSFKRSQVQGPVEHDFYRELFLAPRPSPSLEDNLFSAYLETVSSLHNLRTCHVTCDYCIYRNVTSSLSLSSVSRFWDLCKGKVVPVLN
jgi:hypothetical protein